MQENVITDTVVDIVNGYCQSNTADCCQMVSVQVRSAFQSILNLYLAMDFDHRIQNHLVIGLLCNALGNMTK